MTHWRSCRSCLGDRLAAAFLFLVLCAMAAGAFVGMLAAMGAAVAHADPLPLDMTWRAPDGRTVPQLIAAHVLPDPAQTPGVINPEWTAGHLTLAQVCTPNWTKSVRPPTSFTDKLRAKLTPVGLIGPKHDAKGHRILGPDGKPILAQVAPSDGEVDHGDSIEDLGYPGSPQNVALTLKNLWWMVYDDRYGARVKDVLETKVHRLLCAGKITPDEARAALMPNWLLGYQKYVGSLP